MTTSSGKILGVIPARSGSKRLPGKNTRLIAGKPLISWTIESALKSTSLDAIVITSDSAEILDIASEYVGIDVQWRSKEASSDAASNHDFLVEVLLEFNSFETLVLLQPTSPLRTHIEIDSAVETHRATGCPVVSVQKNINSPFWSFEMSKEGYLQALFPEALTLRSQQLQETYSLNGAIYVDAVHDYIAHHSFLRSNTVPFIMAPEISIDIDNLEDFELAERLLLAQQQSF